MAKSTMRAAPPADEEAEAFLIKPKQSKSSNTKGILALGLLAFALGLLATLSLRHDVAILFKTFAVVAGARGSG